MKFYSISPVANFLRAPTIRANHAAFFHGIAGSNGEWFGIDTSRVDARVSNPRKLNLQLNLRTKSEFTWPSSWPIVSDRLRGEIGDLPHVRFMPVNTVRTIDVEWSKESPIDVDFTSDVALFNHFNEVSVTAAPRKFELQGIDLQSFDDRQLGKSSLTLELGTPPRTDEVEVKLSARLFGELPICRVWGSLIVIDDVFQRIEESIDNDFFHVRLHEI